LAHAFSNLSLVDSWVRSWVRVRVRVRVSVRVSGVGGVKELLDGWMNE
jgi:hypothetical protein